MDLTKKQKEILDSFNGNFDLDIEINGKIFPIQKEVWSLILNISKERDELKIIKNN